MSRLLAYLGPPVRLSDLLHDPLRSPLRGWQRVPTREAIGGFGIGWYVPEVTRQPALIRTVRAPWADANLRSLAEVSRSPCVVCHLREGDDLPNPGRHDTLLFAQAERLEADGALRRPVLESLSDEAFASVGHTHGGNLVFGLLLDLLWARPEPRAHMRLAGALNEVAWRLVATLQERAPGAGLRLNAVLADGDHLVACRFAWNETRLPATLLYRNDPFYTRARPPSRRARERSITTMIASEAEPGDDGWHEIPPGHLVLADRDVPPQHFEMRPRGLRPVRAPDPTGGGV
ncbi:class II glutamine amidotransferase [Gaopeijia maritima]|uniref:Class II glutamine amidotransferase n=1 Tax=Gaopeijia maritima TaxID=3119007 RepID=A0ABU9E9A5_9BACT